MMMMSSTKKDIKRFLNSSISLFRTNHTTYLYTPR